MLGLDLRIHVPIEFLSTTPIEVTRQTTPAGLKGKRIIKNGVEYTFDCLRILNRDSNNLELYGKIYNENSPVEFGPNFAQEDFSFFGPKNFVIINVVNGSPSISYQGACLAIR